MYKVTVLFIQDEPIEICVSKVSTLVKLTRLLGFVWFIPSDFGSASLRTRIHNYFEED